MLFFVISNAAFAQLSRDKIDKITDSLESEGKLLHHSDWASWYGTDIFLAKCPQKRSLSGGFLSYDSGKGWTNIFFTKGDDPTVLATIAFGYDYDKNNYQLDTLARQFTPTERELFTIRHTALNTAEKDTVFKFYKNTDMNPIPIIINGEKRVYILTGTQENNVVIFGNDYLIRFNPDNSISNIKRLHKNIISLATNDTSAVATVHTHLPETGDFITATDICTLMGYEHWQSHYVLSKNYISIWDCKKDELVILTMDAWNRIIKDHAERNKQDPPKK
jgi:hypothetical protein